MATQQRPPVKASDLSTEELLTLVSGKDFWQSEPLPERNIPAIRMSDGPHGMRYQSDEGDHLGINESAKATAFPTASASANTWNLELLRAMGEAIGREARSLGVDITLGPGVNIKRNPLGGRNFEFFSEDPYLAGTLAAAWIQGLQSTGTGASLKHYAANNQEADRLLSNSMIDDTALHELYLEAFRIAVITSQPETVMNAYNQVNGTYMSENTLLLNHVLRGQWGFKGAVITDWGGMNNPVASVNAGTDLEMPGDDHFFKPDLQKALANGSLDPIALARAAEKLIAIATKQRPTSDIDRDTLLADNNEVAERIAEESAVLLKNDGNVLPLTADEPILLVGAMAENTRYQGAGSSHINPLHAVSIKEGLEAAGLNIQYEPGYDANEPNVTLQNAAVEAAKTAKQVVVVVGLPEEAESEGFDRPDMRLPGSHNKLVDALTEVNSHVIVLLVSGAPVELPWRNDVAGLMALYLGGQAVGTATAKLLLGQTNPSGHLAESLPIEYSDVPSSAVYDVNPRSVPYLESLYVGYRYYDKAKVPVAFPFGYGLSYTTFEYNDLAINVNEVRNESAAINVSLRVTNTGSRAGATVVQVYVGDNDQAQLTPEKALKAFTKVFLDAGESQDVTIQLPIQAFRHWNQDADRWALRDGNANVFVALNAKEILHTFSLAVSGEADERPAVPDWYRAPNGLPSAEDFKLLSGYEAAPVPVPRAGHLTGMNTPRELSQFSKVVDKFTKVMLGMKLKEAGNAPDSPENAFLETIILDTPLIRLAQQSSGLLKPWHVKMLVGLANRPVRSRLFGKRS